MVCILFWRCYIAVESFEATRHGEDETGEDCKHRCSANFTHGRPGSGSYFPQIICCCMNIIYMQNTSMETIQAVAALHANQSDEAW